MLEKQGPSTRNAEEKASDEIGPKKKQKEEKEEVEVEEEAGGISGY